MTLKVGNLFADLPKSLPEEQFEVLVEGAGLKIERIISTGQATPPGEWWDQTHHEWVALLHGRAALLFEDEDAPRELTPGDWLHIPANVRHRVEATAADTTTVWLVVHFDLDQFGP